jgi:glycosyltransferase involved in cell wall biosynthesis
VRILYSITKTEIGGAQVHVVQLVQYMKSLGHKVAVISSPGGWLQKEVQQAGGIFYPNTFFSNSYNPIRLIKAYWRTRSVVKDFKPDLVHVHSSFAGIITRLVVRGKIPTIFTAHSWAFTDGAKWTRKIIAPIAERFVAKYTDTIITVSNFDHKLALRYKISSPEKIITIYNGVRDIKGNPQKENILVSVGRLAYPKKFQLLVESFALVNVQNLLLHIVTDGPDRKKIEETIKKLNLSSKVKCLGNLSQNDTHNKLLTSRVFILISKHEGFPLSVLEAMSAGLPVIASKVGGIPEQIDEHCGILVENNSESISGAIEKLFRGNIAETMGKFARVRYEQKFTLQKFLENTHNIYKDVLSSRKNSSNV